MKALLVVVLLVVGLVPLAFLAILAAPLATSPWLAGGGAPASPPPAVVPVPVGVPGVADSDVLAVARTWLGVPYLFGGCSRSGVDCSCFTQLSYAAIGISLPRTAQQQWDATPRVDQASLQPGDLVFFAHTYPSADVITHVGIYLGGGLQLNAPDTGQFVSIQPVFTGFWGSHYAGAGRPIRR